MVDSPSRPAPTAIDAVDVALDRQDVHAELLGARLDRAVDALVEARLALAGLGHDPAARRRILFDLYDEDILTKAQVRQRGELDPAEFHGLLRAHRLQSARTV